MGDSIMGSLPTRRANWTIKVHIEGQAVFLCCEEYPDGTLGGIFLDISKQGTFTRGICDSLARMVSIALQNGTPIEKVISALRGLNFPPSGVVSGSVLVQECTSIPDWIAQELEGVYCLKQVKESVSSGLFSAEGILSGDSSW
jgi:ribonucleoside-diphosphate reductase alpha chain